MSHCWKKQKYKYSWFLPFRFHFVNSPVHKFIRNLKTDTRGALWSFTDTHREAKNLSHPTHVPNWGQTRRRSAFLLQLSLSKQACLVPQSIYGLLSAIFTSLCFLLVILLFKMAPKHGDKVLSSVPSSRRLGCALTEKIRAFNKLRSGMSSSAVGCEFNVYESTPYIK